MTNGIRLHVGQQMKIAGWVVMAYLAVMGAVASFVYVTGDPQQYDIHFRDKYLAHHTVVLLHGICGVLALGLGPFQFWTTFRLRLPGVHRAVGILYLVCVSVAGSTGLFMGALAYGGPWAQAAFCTMAALWLATAAMAFITAGQRRFVEHRAWMLRNYALTFGAFNIRFYLFWLQWFGYAFPAIYPMVSWWAFLPNLVVAEMLVGSRGRWRLPSPPIAIGGSAL